MPNPEGGEIHRDQDGKASGLLSESAAVTIVWPHIAQVAPMEEKLAAIREAVQAYHAAGYTGLVEMAMDRADRYLSASDPGEARAELATLRFLIRHIPEKETLGLKSIL